ncbi:MAG: hypothetical protein JXQ67_00690 [Campylobacterales bacterium]|nr:hypothetical protein [Campylobacterales bacterium]
MKSKYWNIFLVVVFFLLASGGYSFVSDYKEKERTLTLEALYGKIAYSVTNRVDTLIEEKRNATLTVALSLAEDDVIQKAIESKKNIHQKLALFSKRLKDSTDFKNVWIQLLDERGYSISRSWTDKAGDVLKTLRGDVSEMILFPQVRTSISVGKYDLSFKGMVPFYDDEKNFIGYYPL